MGDFSASLKAARAVDGDDYFVARMKVLCVTEGIEYSQRLAYLVALTVADKIVVDEFMTVDTSGVDDNKLKSALTTQATKIGAKQPPPSVAEQIAALTARVDALEPIPAWSEGVDYVTGDQVTYDGATYTCVQSHTSQAGWMPSGLPALWKKI